MKLQTLSRVAERIYWMGRYIERAESTARLIAVHADLLMDLPVRRALDWRVLMDITGSNALFATLHDATTERNVVRYLASDPRNPSSILSSIANAMENMRTVRDTMPRVTFEYVNDLHLFARSGLQGPLSRSRRVEVLEGIARRVQQLEGFLSSNMTHDDKWQFLRLGNHIERADMTTRIIDVRSGAGSADEPFEPIQWRGVLRSLYALQSYQAIMQAPVEGPAVLEFLFQYEDQPRSYASCLNSLMFGLRRLPRSETPLRVCNAMIRHVQEADVRDLEGAGLHDFVDGCQVQLGDLHDAIASTYFHYVPRVPARARRKEAKGQ